MSSPLSGLPKPPLTPAGDAYNFTLQWGGWFTVAHNILSALSTSGTTAQRPTAGLWVGRRYFDTTLGKPIWVQSLSPTVWCDATGAAV